MGRRSINTTKSGKYMNPTDQASEYGLYFIFVLSYEERRYACIISSKRPNRQPKATPGLCNFMLKITDQS